MTTKQLLRTLMVFTIFSLVSTVGFAQISERKSADERNLEWMKTNLSLTESQVPQMQTILSARASRMMEVDNMTREEKKTNKESLKREMQRYDDRIRETLTSKQYAKYSGKKERRKEKMRKKNRD